MRSERFKDTKDWEYNIESSHTWLEDIGVKRESNHN
jgi:hypothetical protein